MSINALDVGCGVGNFQHDILGPQFRGLTGVDVSSASIEQAKARLRPNVAYDVYDGMRLPYPDGAFDLAFTICVMHHVRLPMGGRLAGDAPCLEERWSRVGLRA